MKNQIMILPILYEDRAVMVVNKTAGLATTRMSSGQMSVADLMVAQFPALATIGPTTDAGIVHRLDNDTSGCLIVAKTPESYATLRQQFETTTIIYKEYIALVMGHPPQTGICDLGIIHDPHNSRRMRVAQPSEAAQPAHTEWTVERHFPISKMGPTGYTLVRVRISTGVRHQIRVHMASLGYPLSGDAIYQSRGQQACDKLHPPHHLLHAAAIRFLSPATGQEVRCTAPLSPHFEQALKTLDEIQRRH